MLLSILQGDELKVIFLGKTEVAKNIYEFRFDPAKKINFIAGQFIELYLPHQNKDNRGEKRWFTLSSSPTENTLSITTKYAGEKSSSFKKALYDLKDGTEINMSSPMGDFVLPKDPSIALVFVAGGIGSTPFHSITKYLIDSGDQTRDITMLYAVSDEAEVAYRSDYESLYSNGFRIKSGGVLTTQDILKFYPEDGMKRYIYLSGPEPMIETLNNELKREGVNKKHIHTDFFPGYVSI